MHLERSVGGPLSLSLSSSLSPSLSPTGLSRAIHDRQIVTKAALKWVANSLAPVRANDPDTSTLDWTSVEEIEDSHVAMLAMALSTNTHVRTIDLSNSRNITDSGMQPLLRVLPRTAVDSVATFDYRPNAMVPRGITAPVQKALEMACKRVEKPEAVDCQGKDEALAQATKLLEANGYTVSRNRETVDGTA